MQSAGKRIDLTVRGGENSGRFYPAVWPEEAEKLGPKLGTRVTIPYRKAPLIVPSGERFELHPITHETLRSLYERAVEEAPSRFIAASAPGKRWHYEIAFDFQQEQVQSLRFRCEPIRGSRSGLFRRTCRQIAPREQGRVVRKLIAAPIPLTLADDDRGKVPILFRRGKRIYGELSWNADSKDAPMPGTGGLRYPIGYPIEHQRSGYGFDICGPFISSRARHSVSEDARNSRILQKARTAFAQLLRTRLIPIYGTAALRVIASTRFTDTEAEDLLCEEILNAAALPIARVQRSRKGIRVTLATPKATTADWIPVVASPTYQRDKIAQGLILLASPERSALHPDTPAAVIGILLRFADRRDNPRIKWFNEEDAARAVLLEDSSVDHAQVARDWVARCATALKALDEAARRSALSDSLIKDLRNKGFLPTDFGRVAAWSHVRRSANTVPVIPGVVEPPILARQFNKLGILKEGPLRLAKFNLDEFVGAVDFTKTSAATRQRFFEWLRKTRVALKPKTLSTIATYPIWPDRTGNHTELAYYCWPSSAAMRALIMEIKPGPAESVISFPGLRRGAKSALALRSDPTLEELRTWYEKRMQTVAAQVDQDAATAAPPALRAVEKDLEGLRRSGYDVRAIAEGHRSMSRAGTVQDVRQLHVLTAEVEACGLLDEDLIAGDFTALYTALSAQARPTTIAVLRALKEKPDESRLFQRLDAFKRSGGSLERLSTEPIIQARSQLLAPNEVTLPGAVDYWGKWKTALDKTPAVPESVDLLIQAGVVRQAVREDLSRQFFEWLSDQTTTTQLSHLRQTIRHWRDRAGPSKWWSQYPGLNCLPLRDRSISFELTSHGKATRPNAKIFLPDFPEVQEQLLADVPSCRLVVTEVGGVSGSIMDVVRESGVRSLRMAAGRPTRIVVIGELETDDVLNEALEVVKSPKILKELNQRLPQYEVPISALRMEWRRHLAELGGVRLATQPKAVFRIVSREYEVAVRSGVDQESRLICIDNRVDRKLAFYEAIAAYIFTENASQLWAYGLLRAVENPFAPMLLNLGPVRPDEESDIEGTTRTEKIASIPEVPRKGHGIPEGRLTPTVPDPDPLRDISDRTTLSGKKVNYSSSRRQRTSHDSARHTIEEEEQKLQLKERHYAWHCQACLGEYEVLAATPPRSYIYLPAFRQHTIHAHHVTHLQNKGDIGAKNLLILCRFHHEHIGDKLSHAGLTAALLKARKVIRKFPANEEGTQTVEREGVLAMVELDTKPFRVLLYFTAEHAQAWSHQSES
ncbi:MAG: hypothetical protein ACREU5_00350 [Burkholderiales bacterium]